MTLQRQSRALYEEYGALPFSLPLSLSLSFRLILLDFLGSISTSGALVSGAGYAFGAFLWLGRLAPGPHQSGAALRDGRGAEIGHPLQKQELTSWGRGFSAGRSCKDLLSIHSKTPKTLCGPTVLQQFLLLG